MSSIETVWENQASAEYDYEQDAYYVVRIQPEYPREEWPILISDGTREGAIEKAKTYSERNPGLPVRVERHVL